MTLSMNQLVSTALTGDSAQLSGSRPVGSDSVAEASGQDFGESLVEVVKTKPIESSQDSSAPRNTPTAPPPLSIFRQLAQELTNLQFTPSEDVAATASLSSGPTAQIELPSPVTEQGKLYRKTEETGGDLPPQMIEVRRPSNRTDPQLDIIMLADLAFANTEQATQEVEAPTAISNSPFEPRAPFNAATPTLTAEEGSVHASIPTRDSTGLESSTQLFTPAPESPVHAAEVRPEAQLDLPDRARNLPVSGLATVRSNKNMVSEADAQQIFNNADPVAEFRSPPTSPLGGEKPVRQARPLTVPATQVAASDPFTFDSEGESRASFTPVLPDSLQEKSLNLVAISAAYDDPADTNIKPTKPRVADSPPPITSRSEAGADHASTALVKNASDALEFSNPINTVEDTKQPQLGLRAGTDALGINAPLTNSASPTSAPTLPPTAPLLPPPEQIGAQIRSALAVGGTQDIEIRLDPEELGRVRIILSTKDGGMSVAIYSDKAEVLDLMRRNSDLLEAEFSDIGYEGASFSFQQEREGDHQPPQDIQEQWDIEPPVDLPISHQPQTIGQDARLDMRF